MINLKGRRFRVVKLYNYEKKVGLKEGDEGVILDNDIDVPWVRMDKYNYKLRDAQGLCEEGHGTNMELRQIELLPEEVKKVGRHTTKFKDVVEVNGNSYTLYLTIDKDGNVIDSETWVE